MRRLLVLLAACGGSGDPCDDVDAACIAVRVSSASIEEIDQLELDMLVGEQHSTTTIQPDSGTIALPFDTAIRIVTAVEKPVGIVAAGKLAGMTLGTAAASITIAPAADARIDLVLAPPAVCVAGAYYCGGDKLAG